MCKKYKACTHALTPRYVTIVRGQFAGMRARPLGRSNSAWGGVAWRRPTDRGGGRDRQPWAIQSTASASSAG